MATFVIKSASVVIAGTDISTAVTQVSIDYKAEIQDETAMGDSTRHRLPGMKDWTMNIDVNQDYITAGVDATIFSLVGTSNLVVAVRADTAAAAITNPNYTGIGVLESYMPVQAQIGMLHKSRLVILATGDLTRNTS